MFIIIYAFSTTLNGKPYKLDLQLYNKIEKTFQHSAGGPYIKVSLSKCKKEEWPRLVIQNGMRHITYDMSRCIGVSEEKKKPFLTIGQDVDEPILGDDEHEIQIGSDYTNSDSDVMSLTSD